MLYVIVPSLKKQKTKNLVNMEKGTRGKTEIREIAHSKVCAFITLFKTSISFMSNKQSCLLATTFSLRHALHFQ